MRIRKNTKLSSLLLATAGYCGERPETYNCHFNQSPWDVIPVGHDDDSNLLDSSWFLPSPLSSPPQSLLRKFNGEDNNNHRNVSLGNSNGLAHRLNRSVLSDEGLNRMASDEIYEPMDRSKSKSDDTNSPVKTSGDEGKVSESIPAPPKRGRPRGTGKKLSKAQSFNAASTNPYEFYYYSGFGPRWGKKRGGSGDDNGDNVVMTESNDNNVMSDKKSGGSEEGDGKTASFGEGSSSVDGFEYMDVDDNNNNNNNEIGVADEESDHGMKKKKDEKMMTKKTKRARKPVKERSLKSLM